VTATFPLESFGLLPGDVVSVDGRDHWFQGAWLLSEIDLPVAAFFFASDATIAAPAAPRTELYSLAPCEVELGAGAPFSVEEAGIRFERERRIPVELMRFGSAPELPAREALFLEYRGFGGDVLLVISYGSRSSAWLGRTLEGARVERWGPGV
jgi:hypothetical protein